MINIQSLSKAYGEQVLFEDASLQLSAGERVALIGRNGFGKSTLFRILLGQEQEDQGNIQIPKNYRIGHLEQHLHFTKPTLLEEACLGLREEEIHFEYKAERILFGLGFTKEDMNRDPHSFSGGFQIRLNLAKLLVSEPNLLLLDEPTNYLDIVSIRWIIPFLKAWDGELMLISHDREFLNQVSTHTALIHRQKIRKIKGGTQKLYELIATEEETYEKTRVNEEKQRKHAEAFINRFRAQATKASLVQSRIKELEKMKEKEKLTDIASLSFDFRLLPLNSKKAMDINNISFSFEKTNPLISHLELHIKNGDRIAVIGKNGKGKSTLLSLIAGELKPNQGSIHPNANLEIGYFGQTNIARLDETLTVEGEVASSNPELNRTQVRGICGMMMFSGVLAEKKVSSLSGGEKSRVLLGKIVAKPTNFLLLDEPTNHLDMESIEALTESIHRFKGTVVVVTHSEEMIRRIATKLIVFDRGKVIVFDGSYDEFLEKIGWDEGEVTPKKEKKVEAEKPQVKNKKELRRLRAQEALKKKQSTEPIEKKIKNLEDSISQLEGELKKAHEALIKASEEGNTHSISELSKKTKELELAIEEQFDALEKASKKA